LVQIGFDGNVVGFVHATVTGGDSAPSPVVLDVEEE
jgi:hypothetical protein